MEITKDFKNDLLKRQEISLSLEADNNPNFSEIKKQVAEKLKKDESVVDVYNIKGSFGSNEFKVDVYIYDSKEDLEKNSNKKAKDEKSSGEEEPKPEGKPEESSGEGSAPGEEKSKQAEEKPAEEKASSEAPAEDKSEQVEETPKEESVETPAEDKPEEQEKAVEEEVQAKEEAKE